MQTAGTDKTGTADIFCRISYVMIKKLLIFDPGSFFY